MFSIRSPGNGINRLYEVYAVHLRIRAQSSAPQDRGKVPVMVLAFVYEGLLGAKVMTYGKA